MHLLHRQVHPSWIQQGRPSSQTFLPTPKDEGLLSVNDGSLISAAASYEHYTTTLKKQSAGVVSVSLGEVAEQDLTWRADPEPYPEHAVIDYTLVESNKKVRAKASALAEKARSRGFSYMPAG